MTQVTQPTSQAGSRSIKGSRLRSMFLFCSTKPNMSRIFPAMVLAFCVAACDRSDYNPDRCPDIDGVAKPAMGAAGKIDYIQQSTNLRLCLAKWGFALGRTSDPAPVVANAVAAACTDAIDMKAVGLSQFRQINEALPAAPEPDFATATSEAKQQALFYVIAERAGACSQKR